MHSHLRYAIALSFMLTGLSARSDEKTDFRPAGSR
jgi:ribulose-5-phosphate 4-epimerase/fuculose-1-phosphate aldolase